MKFISVVESNIKTQHGPTALGPKTLILAGNKEGKSAIKDAVEVALTGTASDIVGRPLVKEVNRLLSLAQDGESLFARVTVVEEDDTALGRGQIVEWRTKGKKGGFTAQPLGLYNPVTVFPLRMVREALAGNVESTRKFFIGFVAGGVTDEDVLAALPAPHHEAYRAVTTGLPRTAAVDMLLAGLANAKARLTTTRAEANVRKDVVKETGGTLPPLPSEKEYLAAQEQIAELEVRLAELYQAQGAVKANEQLKGQFTTLRGREEELEQQIDELTRQLTEAEGHTPQPPSEIDTLRPQHLAVLRFGQTKNLDHCPTCKKIVGTLDSLPTNENRAAFWAERVATVEAKATERAGAAQAYRAHEALIQRLTDQINSARSEHARIGKQLESLGMMPEESPAEDTATAIGELKADLDLARGQLSGMEQTRAAWAPILKARNVAAEKEAEIDKWARLIDALKTAIGDLLDKGCSTFVARVQKHLPEGDVFALQLRDEDREVCRYGLMRNGRLHEALSGVEWAYVTAAIAAAAIPDNEANLLHVIVFEDRAWDAQTLLSVMLATRELEAQVIIATTPPEGWSDEVVAGWTQVRLGAQVESKAPKHLQGVDENEIAATEHMETTIAREREEIAEEVTTVGADGKPEVPKFIRDYIAANPKATYADLIREFKLSLNRATAILPPPKRGRPKKVKEEKQIEKIEFSPETAPLLE